MQARAQGLAEQFEDEKCRSKSKSFTHPFGLKIESENFSFKIIRRVRDSFNLAHSLNVSSHFLPSFLRTSFISIYLSLLFDKSFFAFIFSVSFSSRLLYFLLVLSFVSSSSVNITYLHTYLSTYLPTYLLTYLSTYLPTYIPTYISIPLYTNEGIHYSILYLPI